MTNVIRIVILFLLFSIDLSAQSVGYNYNLNYLHSKHFLHWDDRGNIDSAIFYYDKALETGVYYEIHHSNILRSTLLFNKIDATKKYVALGVEKNLTWTEINATISQTKTIKKYLNEKFEKVYPFNDNIKVTDLISKSEYKKRRATSGQPEIKSKWAKNIILKAIKIDQQNGRQFKTQTDKLKMGRNDSIVFQMIKGVIDSLGRIPTVEDVGESAYDELSLFVVHMNACEFIQILPSFITAINNGTYYDNEAIAYTIERISLLDGDYIILNQDSFSIFKDTSSIIGKSPIYSYLGAMSGRIPKDLESDNRKLFIRPSHPKIGKNKIDNFLRLLCLEPLDIFMERNKVVFIDHNGLIVDDHGQ